jgi:hypothetical protein
MASCPVGWGQDSCTAAVGGLFLYGALSGKIDLGGVTRKVTTHATLQSSVRFADGYVPLSKRVYHGLRQSS